MAAFVESELMFAKELINYINHDITTVDQMLRKTGALSEDQIEIVQSLLRDEIPSGWSSKWEGPEKLQRYMSELILRANYASSLLKSSQVAAYQIEKFFNPSTFLSYLRQIASRKSTLPTFCLVKLLNNITSICSYG